MKKESLGITVFGVLFILDAAIKMAQMLQTCQMASTPSADAVSCFSTGMALITIIYGMTWTALFLAGVSFFSPCFSPFSIASL